MSIYKRKNSPYWWIQVWAPGRKQIRRSTGTAIRSKAKLIENTLRMAYQRISPEKNIHALISEIYGSQAAGIPIADVWTEYERWQQASGKTVAEITQRKRRSAATRFADWVSKEWPSATVIDDVSRKMAAAYAATLAEAGTKGKTRKNIISELGTVWEGLRHIQEGIENPWPFVRPEARDSVRGRPFSREQEAAILKASKDGPWWLPCVIARCTGLRYGDIARLEWSCVDTQAEVMSIRPNKTERHEISVALPMVPMLAQAMREARMANPESSYVLPTHAAAYPRPERADGPGAFARVLEAAGVSPDEFTFHSWRHTFRTRLSEAGVSDDLAKRLGGWTSDATAARYDHAARIEEMRAAILKADLA